MRYTLKYSEKASLDLRAIFDYISDDSREAAVAYMAKIEKSILGLADFPEIGHKSLYSELEALGLRILPCDKYLIFYTVDKQNATVNIIRVLHGSRNYLHLF